MSARPGRMPGLRQAHRPRRVPGLHRSLAVLAAPKRFQLLLLVLTGKDRSVSQLARAVRLSQSCTTRHLQALERAGLVRGWRDGKRVVFRPEPRDAAAQAVIASLTGSAAPRTSGLEVIAVASAAELEPLGGDAALDTALTPGHGSEARSVAASSDERVATAEAAPAEPPRARPSRPRRARPPAPVQTEPESGMNEPPPAPGRYWSEIEDYLL